MESGIDYSNSSNESDICDEEAFTVPATLYRKIAGTTIFVIVWPFIVLDLKWFPIGRPAAALLGAAFMVIFTVVPQEQVFLVLGEKGNLQTICLLLGVMILSYYYDREGLLCMVALWVFGQNKPFKHILWKVCVLSAVLSAIITSDATCLVITPLLVKEHVRQGRPVRELPPLLLGISTSANIGSASTIFGNPQNAFIASNSKSEVSLLVFFISSLPAAILGVFLSVAFLYLLYFRVVAGSPTAELDTEVSADHNPNEYSIMRLDPELEPSLVSSLHESREEWAVSYERSTNPNTTVQAAHGKEKVRKTVHTAGASQNSLLASISLKHRSSPRYHRQQDSTEDGPDSVELPVCESSSDTNGYGATHTPTADARINSRKEKATSSNSAATFPRSFAHKSKSSVRVAGGRNPLTRQISSQLTQLPEDVSLSDFSDLSEGEEVVKTEGIWNRTWRAKIFTVWLLVITLVMVTVLAIPPPPTIQDISFDIGLVPLGVGILTMLVDTVLNKKCAYDVMTKVDWSTLLFLMGLFVWLQGFQNTEFPENFFQKVLPIIDLFRVEGVILFTVLVVIGSSILSPVPLAILVVSKLFCFSCGAGNCSAQLSGVLLAWVSTVSGNFTLIGSVANLIVAEKAKACANYPLTFWEYLKFGFLSTSLVLLFGLPLVYFAGRYVNI